MMANKRLIDANEIEELFYKQVEYGATDLIDAFEDALQDAQTVDAVEVVRCKDCLYSTERYGHIECIHGVSFRNTWNKPDFFCSYGERRDDGV